MVLFYLEGCYRLRTGPSFRTLPSLITPGQLDQVLNQLTYEKQIVCVLRLERDLLERRIQR